MSIETDARQEAERRWPALNPGDVELTYPRGALRATARKAFEAGAVWAREKGTQEPSADRARVSDGAVQRVREAIYAQIGHYPTITAAIEILSAALDGEQDTREPSEDPCPEWQCPDLSSEDRREGKTCPDHPCTCNREPSDTPCSYPSGDGSLRHPCQAHPGDTSDREG